MFNWVDTTEIIRKYLNGEINVKYECDDFIKISLDDRKKYNIKPFSDWKTKKPIENEEYHRLYKKLIIYIKDNDLSTLFLLDVSNFLKRGYKWSDAVIFYWNNRLPTHPKIRTYLLEKKRGYIKFK